MNKQYTILSIGPIDNAMQIADNTRAVWTVSYLFSKIMKETITYLLKEKKIEESHFLIPHITDDFKTYMQNGQRIGIFHDRLILKGAYADIVKEAVENAISIIAKVFNNTFEESVQFDIVKVSPEKSKVDEFVRSYFQYYIVETELGSGNPILELSKYMDSMEHQPRLAKHEDEEILFLFLRLTNLGLLQDEAFLHEARDINKERCFKSLPEIAAWELIKEDLQKWRKKHLCLKIRDANELKSRIKNPDFEEEEIIKELQLQYDDKFKPYHKYVAIVHADGDGFGEYLESIDDETKMHAFSDSIFDFMVATRDTIRDYGGYPVVGSGEDLLFFAPVINGFSNIFTLIDEIDNLFRVYFDDCLLSMSYGVSITYYKFPLQEALDLSAEALWKHAKKAQWCSQAQERAQSKSKNAIHIEVRKHSGQSHALTLPKETYLYYTIRKLIDTELNESTNTQLPHALQHSLMRYETLLDSIPSNRIEATFANFFNESIHKNKFSSALEHTQSILKILKQNRYYGLHLCKDDPNDIHQKIFKYTPVRYLFSVLGLIKMLRGDE